MSDRHACETKPISEFSQGLVEVSKKGKPVTKLLVLARGGFNPLDPGPAWGP